MKFDVNKEFLQVVSRIRCTGSYPPCFYAVEYGWEDLKWWNSQKVFNDIDRYAVVTRHISELHKIMYHSVCLTLMEGLWFGLVDVIMFFV